MALPAIAIESILVPDAQAPVPRGFRLDLRSLDAGLPAIVALEQLWNLVVIAPSGLAVPWLTRSAEVVVSSSNEEFSSRVRGALTDTVARSPARLLVRSGEAIVASVPLIAGSMRNFAKGEGNAHMLELMIVGWEIRAGTMRGGGGQGAYLEFAWRTGGPPPTFDTPSPDPRVLARSLDGSPSDGN